MGWSCRAEAAETMDKWTKACVKGTGFSNTFKIGKVQFFWELDNVEQEDGAITGEVIRIISFGKCALEAAFRIEGDGRVSKAPKFLRDVASQGDVEQAIAFLEQSKF